MKKFTTLLLFGLLTATAMLSAAEKPVLRAAIISDTHVSKDINSCRWIKDLFVFLRDREQVDLVINAGDIANLFDPQGYRNYRDTFNQTFAGKSNRPAEIFVYANHDRMGGEAAKRPHAEVFKDVKKLLEIPHDPDTILTFKGYPFLIVNQFIKIKDFESMLSGMAAKYPDKPLFVIDHLPPSLIRNDRRQLMKKYPSVIHISGHTHGSLFDEKRIWQDGFTAINISSFGMEWAGKLMGSRPEWQDAYEFCIMEVFSDKVVFRRYSILNKKEINPEAPWTVPLPYDDATAPFTYERRKAKSTAPEFAKGAKLSVSVDKIPFRRAFLHIPFVEGARLFNIEIAEAAADGTWKTIARKQEFNKFFLLPEDKARDRKSVMYGAYFTPGKRYRFTTIPENFFGKTGKAISTEWLAPARLSTKTVFESSDPMNDERLSYKNGLAGGKNIPVVDGFYDQKCANARLSVPAQTWKNKGSNLYWATIDIHSIQLDGLSWNINWRNPKPRKNAHSRISTWVGDVANRYVMEFRLSKGHKPYLLVREGGKGKIRFDYLKIEQVVGK